MVDTINDGVASLINPVAGVVKGNDAFALEWHPAQLGSLQIPVVATRRRLRRQVLQFPPVEMLPLLPPKAFVGCRSDVSRSQIHGDDLLVSGDDIALTLRPTEVAWQCPPPADVGCLHRAMTLHGAVTVPAQVT